LQPSSPPLQSALVSRFDQIEAVGIVNCDVPIEGNVKRNAVVTQTLSATLSRGSSHFVSASLIFAILAADRSRNFSTLAVRGRFFVFVGRVAHGSPAGAFYY
jgi:hypothetical protein